MLQFYLQFFWINSVIKRKTDRLLDQRYITFYASGAAVLSDECPPMIPIQSGFEDKIGERPIDVPAKRRKYVGYHNRYVFKR
jgi:hypothetical protein